MDRKIKKTLTRISILTFASSSFLVAFLPKIIWSNSLNLKEIESGSKKVWKGALENFKVNSAEADTVQTYDCGSGSNVGGCGDSAGDGGAGGAADGGCDGAGCGCT